MKKTIAMYAMALVVLISACGAQAAPTIDGVSVQKTSEAAAFTLVAQTQAALPTNTLVPPTEAATETAEPTNTPEALPTLDLSLTPTLTASADLPTLAPTTLPNLAPTTASSTSNDCNHLMTSWIVPTANFNIVNETKPQGKVILLLTVATKTGDCGWINAASSSFSGPMGNYSAAAYVDGKKSFKVYGTFFATAQSWDIIVRNDRIALQNSCYPNC
jgi:hypothetical protein